MLKHDIFEKILQTQRLYDGFICEAHYYVL